MHTTKHIVKHLREFYTGGSWTGSNLKSQLNGVTWQQATTSVYTFNTIAVLVYHINYYVAATIQVLEGHPLDAQDQYSFNCPPITSQATWQQLVAKAFSDAEHFTTLLEKLPEATLWQDIADPKQGDYYRNIQGIVEHNHYHLGQIVLIKKIVQGAKK